MAGIPTERGYNGGLWETHPSGVAQVPTTRPALTGGLQQMGMYNAYRQGAPMSQIQAMNPYTPRPAQFLPSALPAYSWAADASNPANQVRSFASGLTNVANGWDSGTGSAGAGSDASDGAGPAGGAGAGAGDGGGGGGGGAK